ESILIHRLFLLTAINEYFVLRLGLSLFSNRTSMFGRNNSSKRPVFFICTRSLTPFIKTSAINLLISLLNRLCLTFLYFIHSFPSILFSCYTYCILIYSLCLLDVY